MGKPEAERYHDQFIGEFGFTKFFIGIKSQTVIGSIYSSVKTTMTREVKSSGLLAVTMDESREAQIHQEITSIEGLTEQLHEKARNMDGGLKQKSIDLESARRLHKDLEQKKTFRVKQTAKIEVQRKAMRQLMGQTDIEK